MIKSVKIFILINLIFNVIGISAQTELIIESTKGGKNNGLYKEFSGVWYDSVAKSTVSDVTPNIGSRFIECSGVNPAEARFNLEISEEGNYHVYVTWPRQANSIKAVYKIKSADGETDIIKAQNGWGKTKEANGNMWHDLGVYKFNKGNEHYISILKGNEKVMPTDIINSARIYADAVKIVKTDKPVKKAENDNIEIFIQQADSAKTQVSQATPKAEESPISILNEQDVSVNTTAIQWLYNVQEAKNRAKLERKNTLIYFFSKGSDYCKKYDDEVFNDANVIEKLNKSYICAMIDFNLNYDYSLNLSVYRVPSILIYDSDGNLLTKLEGFKNKADFLKTILEF